MLPFSETRFNTGFRYGSVGGPEFNTDVTTVTSGSEFRNSNWLDARGKWQMADDLYNKQEIEELTSFFRERMGKAGGFRFKDWADFETTYPTIAKPNLPINGVFVQIAPGILQMAKLYTVGTRTVYRIITKPVPGTVTYYGVGEVDYTTGRVAGTGTPVTGSDPNIAPVVTGMNWAGEFDVPARFDTDSFQATFEGYREEDGERLFGVNGLTIVELRPEYPEFVSTTPVVAP